MNAYEFISKACDEPHFHNRLSQVYLKVYDGMGLFQIDYMDDTRIRLYDPRGLPRYLGCKAPMGVTSIRRTLSGKLVIVVKTVGRQ